MSTLLQLEIPILQRLARSVYNETDLDFCADPTLIAAKLGLTVRVTEGPGCLEGNVLFEPAVQSRRDAGLVGYRLVARWLLRRDRASFWSEDAEERLANALILPRIVAKRATRACLPTAQRYAPVALIERIWLSYPDRGTQVVDDEERAGEEPAVVIPFKPRAPKRKPGSMRTAL